jgi:hypothetical protein
MAILEDIEDNREELRTGMARHYTGFEQNTDMHPSILDFPAASRNCRADCLFLEVRR